MPEKDNVTGLLTQAETNYTTLSPSGTEACANCRWFRSAAYEGQDACHLVDCYPLPILPTGLCDRHEEIPVPEPIPDAVVEAIEGLGETIEDMMEDMTEVEMSWRGDKHYTIAPVQTSGMLDAVKRTVKRSALQSGVKMLTDKAGRRYLFMVTSNGYKDRDKEHVATKALQAYVDNSWTKDNTAFIGEQEHLIWHDDRLGSMSDLVFADVWDGFLVEIWREQNHPIAKAFYTYVQNHPEIKWGASHGFLGVKENDTFEHIFKRESSTLPLSAASNVLTLSEVL